MVCWGGSRRPEREMIVDKGSYNPKDGDIESARMARELKELYDKMTPEDREAAEKMFIFLGRVSDVALGKRQKK